MSIFTGAGVAIATPMHADGSINYEAFGKLIDFQIENGTDAIVVCGTTGEAATMTPEEHFGCIEYTVKKVAGRVPVIAGTGSNNTAKAVENAKRAEALGVDGLLVVTPFYNKATQKGLILHFTAVAESVNIPIILYNVPGRTGCNIQPKTVAELAKVKNIVGIKEASGSLAQVSEMASLAGPDFDIYSGEDGLVLPILSVGGKGVISVLSNVAPKDTHDMVMKFMEGDLEGARKLQLGALDLIAALFCEVNPIPVKEALNMMGFAAGPCRLPLCAMEEKTHAQLEAAMKAYGLI